MPLYHALKQFNKRRKLNGVSRKARQFLHRGLEQPWGSPASRTTWCPRGWCWCSLFCFSPFQLPLYLLGPVYHSLDGSLKFKTVAVVGYERASFQVLLT